MTAPRASGERRSGAGSLPFRSRKPSGTIAARRSSSYHIPHPHSVRRRSMPRTTRPIPVIAVCLAVVLASAGQKAVGQKSERINKTGQIVSVAPGLITAKADGDVYTLKFSKDRNIVAVTGNLQLSQLQRGMLVRCTGTLKGNTIEGEAAELKVFGAADGYQLGVLQDAPDQPATVSGQLSKI